MGLDLWNVLSVSGLIELSVSWGCWSCSTEQTALVPLACCCFLPFRRRQCTM